MMSAPSEMDEGAPKVGELLLSKELIPIPPPVALQSPAPDYKVGVMQ